MEERDRIAKRGHSEDEILRGLRDADSGETVVGVPSERFYDVWWTRADSSLALRRRLSAAVCRKVAQPLG